MRKRILSDGDIVINRAVRRDSATLFPGHQLQEYVKGHKSGAVLIGDLFESVTQQFIGGLRQTTDGRCTVCPDAVDERRKLWLESKGSQCRHPFKVDVEQLALYRQAQYERAVWGENYRVSYCLWSYAESRVTKARNWSKNCKPDMRVPTKEELIRLVLGAVKNVDVLDLSIVSALKDKCESERTRPNTCRIVEYGGWRASSAGDRPYCTLQVGHAWLRALREDPGKVLRELDFDLDTYRVRQNVETGMSVTLDGVLFDVPPVASLVAVRPRGWIEYPEAGKNAPF